MNYVLISSWEKQQWYKLANGYTAIVEHNPHYGLMVTGLFSETAEWSCCNGLQDIPDYARPWVKNNIVTPGFLY